MRSLMRSPRPPHRKTGTYYTVAFVLDRETLMRDAVRGFLRVRRRSRERGDRPEMAKIFNPPPAFLNHVVSPLRTFASGGAVIGRCQRRRQVPRRNVQRHRAGDGGWGAAGAAVAL